MKLQLSQNSIEFSRKNVTKYSRKFEITSSNRVQNPQIEDPLYGQAIVLYCYIVIRSSSSSPEIS